MMLERLLLWTPERKGIERGFAPLRNLIPSPLHKGRGKKGEGLINNLLQRFGIALLIVLLFASPVQAQTTAASNLAQQLICQCGCTLTLANCTHGECMSRTAMTTLIEQKLEQGQSEEQIIAFFVAQYGEQVLASPPKRGFNLVAWITPFAAILAGAAIIVFALKTWVKRGGQSATTTTTESGEGEEKYRQQVEQELKEFRERGFR